MSSIWLMMLQPSPHGSQEWRNVLVWVASRVPSYHAGVQCCFSFPDRPWSLNCMWLVLTVALFVYTSFAARTVWGLEMLQTDLVCSAPLMLSALWGKALWFDHFIVPSPGLSIKYGTKKRVWDGVQTKPCQRALWKLTGGKVRMPFLLCYLWKLGMEVLVVDVFQIGQSWRVKSNGTYCKILSNGTALADHDFQIADSCKAPYIDVTI